VSILTPQSASKHGVQWGLTRFDFYLPNNFARF